MIVDKDGEEFLEEDDVLMLIAAIIGVSIEEAKGILTEAVDSGEVTEYVLGDAGIISQYHKTQKKKGLVQ